MYIFFVNKYKGQYFFGWLEFRKWNWIETKMKDNDQASF